MGLHAIMPSVLDGYWSLSTRESRIAPPLQLRYSVPAVGTAAVFALTVGWQDASNVYGILLGANDEAYQNLQLLHEECKAHRWRHGINARYYGENPTRLDMSPFSALAGTVVGVYESAAENATLLSKNLAREGLAQKAIGAPPK